jgi:hypothetical protein
VAVGLQNSRAVVFLERDVSCGNLLIFRGMSLLSFGVEGRGSRYRLFEIF